MTFTLPNLPFEKTALEPFITSNTLDFHHGKHHNAYVGKLNELIEGTEFAGKTLEEIIVASNNKNAGVFNNAAQVWNHSFYWHSMQSNGGGEPTGAIADKINADFGSYAEFKKQFHTAGMTQFGSGWAWLVLDGDKLKIVKTPNAESPITEGLKPIITADVWEHAYYLDFQNKRPDYLNTFLDKLVNWDFANSNLTGKGFKF